MNNPITQPTLDRMAEAVMHLEEAHEGEHTRHDNPLRKLVKKCYNEVTLPSSSFSFFFSCRELAIQTMRYAITLEETFTLQYTDEISLL